MEIKQFQQEIVRDRLQGYNDDDDWWVSDDLKFYVGNDGTLSCSFNGSLIPCESRNWEETLDIIANFIKEQRPIK